MVRILRTSWLNETSDYKNTILLKYDNWDDYGYKTTYNLAYYDKDGKQVFNSYIQIYCTELDEYKQDYGRVDMYIDCDEIMQLDERFCSIGADISFYNYLKNYLPNDYRDVLRRLNDLAYDRERWEQFKKYKGVQKSLLRSSSAEKARVEAYKLLEENEDNKKSLSFNYEAKVPYNTGNILLFFSFEKNINIPYRINALVGKNGTGKTQILNQLAEDLSGFKDSHYDRNEFGESGRPAFDKVMSISYSAFDSFKKLRGEKSLNSYVYCGIQSENGTLKLDQIQENFRSALAVVRKKNRYTIWKKIITELFAEENYNIMAQLEEDNYENINWSSGQHILISSMTEVIAKIDKESIILFDEPEIHLHPNAISNVMRMFNMVLEEFDSYAIIATHSPIILQEIPSGNIVVFERIDNQLFVRKPEIECFGENITQITKDIFDVTSNESCYQSTFIKLKNQGKSKEEIEKIFNHNLGLNASIFLENIYR